MMPGMDGGDVKNGLHEIPGLRELPVIFLTGAKQDGEVNDKDTFLSKPAKVKAIVAAIDQRLSEEIGEHPPAG